MRIEFIEECRFAAEIDADDFETAKEIAIQKYYNGEISTENGCYTYTSVGDDEHGMTVVNIGCM